MVKLLTNKIVKPGEDFIQTFLLCLLLCVSTYGQTDVDKNKIKTSYGSILNFELITDVQNQVLMSQDSTQQFKDTALSYANEEDAEQAVVYIKKYIGATGDMSIINDHLFESISDTPAYVQLKETYIPKLGILSTIYFYAGFLGLFLFVILNLRSNTDRVSTLLISLFVLFHSLFILHLSLYRVNYQYYIPHALYASTTFSFLYGPLLYFYFRRTIYNYKFKYIDAIHLVPSILLLLYILPFYSMSRLEKFNIIFNQSSTLLPGAYVIIAVKILSLSLYAFLILKMYKGYRENLHDRVKNKQKASIMWQRNIIVLYLIYVVAYLFYAASITGIIGRGLIFHIQILVMVGVVIYVAYIAYAQPEIFKGKIKLVDPMGLFKYKKSGLTPSLSLELKANLLKLLHEEKIYKENDINLETLAVRLGTTRHNASQVINEHFKMSFSELMNQYRIVEAAEILKNDEYRTLSIIQVAYEVGYNNKVSFNKSFKKQFSLTPSQFIKTYRA